MFRYTITRRPGREGFYAVLFLLYGVTVAVVLFASWGTPIAREDVFTSLGYWTRAVLTFTVVVLLFGFVVDAIRSRALLSAVMLLLGIWMIVHIADFVLLILEIFSCETVTECADNARCDGTFVGPYGGPSGAFLVLFVANAFSVVIEAAIVYQMYNIVQMTSTERLEIDRRTARRRLSVRPGVTMDSVARAPSGHRNFNEYDIKL